MRQAQELLSDTWPRVRDGSSPADAVAVGVWRVVVRIAGHRTELTGDPRDSPVDFALVVLAMTRVHLAESAPLRRSLLAIGPAENRLAFCRSAALALVLHAERTREPVCLDAGLILTATVLANEPADAVGHDIMVRASKLRFELVADARDDDRVLQHARASVEQTPDGAVDLVRRLHQLGQALTARATRLRDEATAHDAVRVLRRASALTGSDPLLRVVVLSSLISALVVSAAKAAGVEELDEALAVSRELQAITASAPLRGQLRDSHARLLALRFARRNDPEVLDETIAAYRALRAEARQGTPAHGQWSGHLGRHVLYRTFGVDDPAALNEATRLLFESAREAGAEALDGDVLTALVTAVSHTTADSADLAAVDEVIEMLTEATEPGRRHARTPGVLADLSRLIGIKGTHTRQVDLARQRETYARRAVEAAEPGAGSYATYQSVLGDAIIGRHQEGPPGISDDGVDLIRTAIRTGDPAWREHAEDAGRLADALFKRSELTNHRASLDEAITLMRERVVNRARGGPERHPATVRLAIMLATRARKTGSPVDAGEARDLLRAEIERLPDDHIDMPAMHVTLGQALYTIARLEYDENALAESERHFELVAESPEVSPVFRCGALHSLATVLLGRFDRDPSVVDRVVDLCRASLAGMRGLDLNRHVVFVTLGRALSLRALLGERDEDMVAAKALFGELVDDPTVLPIIRIVSAAGLGRLAQVTDHPAAALAVLRQGITLLPMLTRHAIDRADQELLLRHFHDLSRMAARVAIECGEPAQAVELLEHGRAVLTAQVLETRMPLTELANLEPELAARLERLRIELDQSSGIEGWLWETTSATAGQRADHRHRLAREWAAALAEVRDRPGFTDFLQPPRFDQLLRVADDGPVVVLNTDQQCAALLLTTDGVHVCPLPDLSIVDAEQAVALLFDDGSGLNDADPDAERMIANVLDWLWRVVAEPVLDALDLTGPPRDHWPRIWWCPTGPLSFLPVHAAASASGPAVLDRAVSSYTPTLSALLQARARPRPRTRETLALVVSNLAGFEQLPGARREAEALVRIADATVLTDEEATFAALRRELARHNCVHFACHGVQDTDDPSTGRLLLAGGEVRVTDIVRLRLDDAYLAFLSACETAVGGSALPDEAVHMAGAMHLAGFRNVIGTMWRVADDPAAVLATRVYEALDRGDDVAHALHGAVRAVRAERPDRPSAWASHVHIGP